MTHKINGFVSKLRKATLTMVFVLAFLLTFSIVFTGVETELLGTNTATVQNDAQVAQAYDGDWEGNATAQSVYSVTGTGTTFATGAGAKSFVIGTNGLEADFPFSWGTSMSGSQVTATSRAWSVNGKTHSGDDWFYVDYFIKVTAADNPQLYALLQQGQVNVKAEATITAERATVGMDIAASANEFDRTASVSRGQGAQGVGVSGTGYKTKELTTNRGMYYFRWTFWGHHSGTLTDFKDCSGSGLNLTFTKVNDTTGPTINSIGTTDSTWLDVSTSKAISVSATDSGLLNKLYFAVSDGPTSTPSYTSLDLYENGSVPKYYTRENSTNRVNVTVDGNGVVHGTHYYFYVTDMCGNMSAVVTKTLFDFYIDPFKRDLTVSITNGMADPAQVGYINQTVTIPSTATTTTAITLPWTTQAVTINLSSARSAASQAIGGIDGTTTPTYANLINGVGDTSSSIRLTLEDFNNRTNTVSVSVKSGTGVTSAVQSITIRYDNTDPTLGNPGIVATTNSSASLASGNWASANYVDLAFSANTSATNSMSGVKLKYSKNDGVDWTDFTPTTGTLIDSTVAGGWYTGSLQYTLRVYLNDDGNDDGMLNTTVRIRAYNRFWDGNESSVQRFHNVASFVLKLDTVAPRITSFTYTAVAGAQPLANTSVLSDAIDDGTVTINNVTYPKKSIPTEVTLWTFDAVSIRLGFSDKYKLGESGLELIEGDVRTAFSGLRLDDVIMHNRTGAFVIPSDLIASQFAGVDSSGYYYTSGIYQLDTDNSSSYRGERNIQFLVRDQVGNGVVYQITQKIETMSPVYTPAIKKGSTPSNGKLPTQTGFVADVVEASTSNGSYNALGSEPSWYNDYVIITLNATSLPLSGANWYFWASQNLHPGNNEKQLSDYRPVVDCFEASNFGGNSIADYTIETTASSTKLTVIVPKIDAQRYYYFQLRSNAYSGTSSSNLSYCYAPNVSEGVTATSYLYTVKIDGTAPTITNIRGYSNDASAIQMFGNDTEERWSTGSFKNVTAFVEETNGAGSGLASIQGAIFYKTGSTYNNLTPSDFSGDLSRIFINSDSQYGNVNTSYVFFAGRTLALGEYSDKDLYVGMRASDLAGNTQTEYTYIRIYVDNAEPGLSITGYASGMSGYWDGTQGEGGALVESMNAWYNGNLSFVVRLTTNVRSNVRLYYCIGSDRNNPSFNKSYPMKNGSGQDIVFTQATPTAGKEVTVTLDVADANGLLGNYRAIYDNNGKITDSAWRFLNSGVYFYAVNATGKGVFRGLNVKLDKKSPEIEATVLKYDPSLSADLQRTALTPEALSTTWLGGTDIHVLLKVRDDASALFVNSMDLEYWNAASNSYLPLDIRNSNQSWTGLATQGSDGKPGGGNPVGSTDSLYSGETAKNVANYTFEDGYTYYQVKIPATAFGAIVEGNVHYSFGALTFRAYVRDNAENSSATDDFTINVDSATPNIAISYQTEETGKGVIASQLGATIITSQLDAAYTDKNITFTINLSPASGNRIYSAETPGNTYSNGSAITWKYSVYTVVNSIGESVGSWSAWTDVVSDGDIQFDSGSGTYTVNLTVTDETYAGTAGTLKEISGVAYRFMASVGNGLSNEMVNGSTAKPLAWVVCFQPYREVTHFFATLSAKLNGNGVITSDVNPNDEAYNAEEQAAWTTQLVEVSAANRYPKEGVVGNPWVYRVGDSLTYAIDISKIPYGYYFAGIQWLDDGPDTGWSDNISSDINKQIGSDLYPIHYMSNGIYSGNKYTVTHVVTSVRASDGSYPAFRIIINPVPIDENFNIKARAGVNYAIQNLDKSYNNSTMLGNNQVRISQLVGLFAGYQTADRTDLANATKNFAAGTATDVTTSVSNLFAYSLSYGFKSSIEGSIMETRQRMPNTITSENGGPGDSSDNIKGTWYVYIQIYLAVKIDGGDGYRYVRVNGKDGTQESYEIAIEFADIEIAEGNIIIEVPYGTSLGNTFYLFNGGATDGTTTGSTRNGTWKDQNSVSGGANLIIAEQNYSNYVAGTTREYQQKSTIQTTFSSYDDESSQYVYYGGRIVIESINDRPLSEYNTNYLSAGSSYNVKVSFARWTSPDSTENLSNAPITLGIKLYIVKARVELNASNPVTCAEVGYGEELKSTMFNLSSVQAGASGYQFLNKNIAVGTTYREVLGTLSWVLLEGDFTYIAPNHDGFVTGNMTIARRYIFTPLDSTNYEAVGDGLSADGETADVSDMLYVNVKMKKIIPKLQFIKNGTLQYGQTLANALVFGTSQKFTDTAATGFSILDNYPTSNTESDFYITNPNTGSAVEGGIFTWANPGYIPNATGSDVYKALLTYTVTATTGNYNLAYEPVTFEVSITVNKASIILTNGTAGNTVQSVGANSMFQTYAPYGSGVVANFNANSAHRSWEIEGTSTYDICISYGQTLAYVATNWKSFFGYRAYNSNNSALNASFDTENGVYVASDAVAGSTKDDGLEAYNWMFIKYDSVSATYSAVDNTLLPSATYSGIGDYYLVMTPTNTSNYYSVCVPVRVRVDKTVAPSLTAWNTTNIVYGSKISASEVAFTLENQYISSASSQYPVNASATKWAQAETKPSVKQIYDARALAARVGIEYGRVYTGAQLKSMFESASLVYSNTTDSFGLISLLAYNVYPQDTANYVTINNVYSEGAKNFFVFLEYSVLQATPYFTNIGQNAYTASMAASDIYFGQSLKYSAFAGDYTNAFKNADSLNEDGRVEGHFEWIDNTIVPNDSSYNANGVFVSAARFRVRWIPDDESTQGGAAQELWNYTPCTVDGSGSSLTFPVRVQKANAMLTLGSVNSLTYGEILSKASLNFSAYRLIKVNPSVDNDVLRTKSYNIDQYKIYYRKATDVAGFTTVKYIDWRYYNDASNPHGVIEEVGGVRYGDLTDSGELYFLDTTEAVGAISASYVRRISNGVASSVDPSVLRPNVADRSNNISYLARVIINNDEVKKRYNYEDVTALNYWSVDVVVSPATLEIRSISTTPIVYGQSLDYSNISVNVYNPNFDDDDVSKPVNANAIERTWASGSSVFPTVANSEIDQYPFTLKVKDLGASIVASNYYMLTGATYAGALPCIEDSGAYSTSVKVLKAKVDLSDVKFTIDYTDIDLAKVNQITSSGLTARYGMPLAMLDLTAIATNNTASSGATGVLLNPTGVISWSGNDSAYLNAVGNTKKYYVQWTPNDTVNYETLSVDAAGDKIGYALTVTQAEVAVNYIGSISKEYATPILNATDWLENSFFQLSNPYNNSLSGITLANNGASWSDTGVMQKSDLTVAKNKGGADSLNSYGVALTLANNAETNKYMLKDIGGNAHVLVKLQITPYNLDAESRRPANGYATETYEVPGTHTVQAWWADHAISMTIPNEEGNNLPISSLGRVEFCSLVGFTDMLAQEVYSTVAFNGSYAGRYAVRFVPNVDSNYSSATGFVQVQLPSPAVTPIINYKAGAGASSVTINYGTDISATTFLNNSFEISSGAGTFSWATKNDGLMGTDNLMKALNLYTVKTTAYKCYLYWTPNEENKTGMNRVSKLIDIVVIPAELTVGITDSSYVNTTTGLEIIYGQSLSDKAFADYFVQGNISVVNSSNSLFVLEANAYDFAWVSGVDVQVHENTTADHTYTAQYEWLNVVPKDSTNYIVKTVPIKATVKRAQYNANEALSDLRVTITPSTSLEYGQTLAAITAFDVSVRNKYNGQEVSYNAPLWVSGNTVPDANYHAGAAIVGKQSQFAATLAPADTRNYASVQYGVAVRVYKAIVSIANYETLKSDGLKYGMSLDQAMNTYGVLAFSDNITATNSKLNGEDKTVAGSISWVADANVRLGDTTGFTVITSGKIGLYIKWTPNSANESNYVTIVGGTSAPDGRAYDWSNYKIMVSVNQVDLKGTSEVGHGAVLTINPADGFNINRNNANHNTLIYGQSLSAATVAGYTSKNPYNNADVEGTFAWVNASSKPNAGAAGAAEMTITFTPSGAKAAFYKEITFNQGLPQVLPCTEYVYVGVENSPQRAYLPYGKLVNMTNLDIATKVQAKNKYDNSLPALVGTYKWTDARVSQLLAVGTYGGGGSNNPLSFSFVPSASSNYTLSNYGASVGNDSMANTSLIVIIEPASPTIGITNLTTTQIYYGFPLNKSTFTNYAVKHTVEYIDEADHLVKTREVDVQGAFSWDTGATTMPQVSDSNTTSYNVTWTPAAAETNYKTTIDYVNGANEREQLTAKVVVNKANLLAKPGEIYAARNNIVYGEFLSDTAIVSTLYNREVYEDGTLTKVPLPAGIISGVEWDEPTIVPAATTGTAYNVRIYLASSLVAANFDNVSTATIDGQTKYFFNQYYTPSASEKTRAVANIVVKKANFDMPGRAAINSLTYGQKLSAAGLSDVDAGTNVAHVNACLNPNYKGEQESYRYVAAVVRYAEPNSILGAGNQTVQIVLTPNDTDNYEITRQNVIVRIAKATATVIKDNLQSPAITYGDILQNAGIVGKTGMNYAINPNADPASQVYAVVGTFAWENPNLVPHVADSNRTLQPFRFIPQDNANYNETILDTSNNALSRTFVVNPKTITIGAQNMQIAEDTVPTTFYATDAIFENGKIKNVEEMIRGLIISGLVEKIDVGGVLKDNVNVLDYSNMTYTIKKATQEGGALYDSANAEAGETYYIYIEGIRSTVGDYNIVQGENSNIVATLSVRRLGSIAFKSSETNVGGNIVSYKLPTDADFTNKYGNIAGASYKIGYYDEAGQVVTLNAVYVEGDLLFSNVGNYDYFVIVEGAAALEELHDYSTVFIVIGSVMVALGAIAIALFIIKSKKQDALVVVSEEEKEMQKLFDELNIPQDEE